MTTHTVHRPHPRPRRRITRVCRPDTGLGYSRPIDNGDPHTPIPAGVALHFFTGRQQEATR
jgi:hypothetical protein